MTREGTRTAPSTPGPQAMISRTRASDPFQAQGLVSESADRARRATDQNAGPGCGYNVEDHNEFKMSVVRCHWATVVPSGDAGKPAAGRLKSGPRAGLPNRGPMAHYIL